MPELEQFLERAQALLDRVERLLPVEPPEPDFAGVIAFRWRRRGGRSLLQPVAHPHGIQLEDLQDIDRQRDLVQQNTLQFVRGLPANNVLLTGARGTGKSSLIKALLNRYAADGLRLIELDKQDLLDLPEVVERLAAQPYRFILFCDDLSFNADEPGYTTLKAVLDGSVAATPENVLLYATSNRRHLMPEFMRENLETKYLGDEIHPGRRWKRRSRCRSGSACGSRSTPSARTSTWISCATGCADWGWVKSPTRTCSAKRCSGRCSAGRAAGAWPGTSRGTGQVGTACAAADSAMTLPPRVVDVAAAVITRADGRFLLQQRPPGKVYAGYWEFPGGKAERGEPLATALGRELHEEIGIDVERAYPWIVEEYVYPHAHVRLHFFRVLEWRGEPHPREQQRLSWAALDDLGVTPLLPANGPVLRALALPPILAITNASELGVAAALERVERALARGVRLVMVREKQMASEQLLGFSVEVVARCRRSGAQVVVNSDAHVAQVSAADGLHLPSASLMRATVRPPFALCGASCHDAPELRQAAELGLDYVVLGPVLPTPSHPQAAGLGWERLRESISSYRLPVYALGGMREAHLEQAWKAGAHGVALMRAL